MVENHYLFIRNILHKEHKKIDLVQSEETGNLYLRKVYDQYNIDIFKTIQLLNHPNVPQIYEIEEKDHQLTLIEQYIAAPTLEEYLDEQKISEDEAVEIVLAICDILNVFHRISPPVIHRDLTLKNILYSQHKIYLIDFDISRFYDETKNKDTMLMGTAGYVAPEQYGYLQSNQLSDIYQLGVVFHLLLTGFFPKEINYNGKYSELISKMLSLDPLKRPPSVEVVKKEIEKLKYLNIKFIGLYHFFSQWIYILAAFYVFIVSCLCFKSMPFLQAIFVDIISSSIVVIPLIVSKGLLNTKKITFFYNSKNILLRFLGILLTSVILFFILFLGLFFFFGELNTLP